MLLPWSPIYVGSYVIIVKFVSLLIKYVFWLHDPIAFYNIANEKAPENHVLYSVQHKMFSFFGKSFDIDVVITTLEISLEWANV